MSFLKKYAVLGIAFSLLMLIACQGASRADNITTTIETTTSITVIETDVLSTTKQIIMFPYLDTVTMSQFFEENIQRMEQITTYLLEVFDPQKMQFITTTAGLTLYYMDREYNMTPFRKDITALSSFIESAERKTGYMVNVRIEMKNERRVISFSFAGLDANANIVYLPDGVINFPQYFPDREINFTYIENNWWSWHF